MPSTFHLHGHELCSTDVRMAVVVEQNSSGAQRVGAGIYAVQLRFL
jgi:hypothetical protein